MKLIDLFETRTRIMLYHLTDNARFDPDPTYAPEDNALAINDRSGMRGIYLARSVETWVNGHDYWRPFVAVFSADPSVFELDQIGRWGNEVFVSSEHFDLIRLERIIPLDAWAREEYGMHGWLEDALGIEFDTSRPITSKAWEQPFQNYRYHHDLRTASNAEIAHLKKQFVAAMKARN